VDAADQIQAKYDLLEPYLKGRLRALWAASEAAQLGRGGIRRVADLTGIGAGSIYDALRQLRGSPRRSRYQPTGRPRRRKCAEEVYPTLIDDLERLLADELAGDPMSETTWVRSSSRNISKKLAEMGYQVSWVLVCRLLKKMGFSLRRNKKREGGSRHPNRDEQFQYIASQKLSFLRDGQPVISIDTKKKELIGPFRNHGRAWCRQPDEVHEHDFTSAAEFRAVPFGVYDLGRNEGYVTVGISNDTPEFAVNAIARWWKDDGRRAYPGAQRLLILADCGGTNGHRHRAWKLNVQERLSDGLGLAVTVCHYPPGCSKWNPIERRLFSQISVNWEGKPLRSLDIMLGYIRGTTTAAGLKVKAFLDEGTYRKGQTVTHADVDRLQLTPHATLPEWNYTITPRAGAAGTSTCQ
jgi:Rhodopirellula transposase DDE domain